MKKNKFDKFWKNKKILITGCTGFTGSWLVMYLLNLNAKIYGYSLDSFFKNSMFDLYNLKKKINFFNKNILNIKDLEKVINYVDPHIIFHLAAEPIVKRCYKNPLKAFETNALGTLNLLEVLRKKNKKKLKSLNIITTDKVYKNNKKKKFIESDQLSGDDPYSSSKACAELMCESYYNSFFCNQSFSFNIFRSGNIIGGGDWSENRIVPDIMRSIKNNSILKIKNPNFTRPWQHILDVIYSYTEIAKKTYKKNKFDQWNIGPKSNNISVKELINIFKKNYKKKLKISYQNIKKNNYEKKNLSLNSSKLKKKLNIYNFLDIKLIVIYTLKWYLSFFKNKNNFNYTKNQIKDYLSENVYKKKN